VKIYTRTGDQGQTGLIGGVRVPKDHARVAAFGEIDELNAALGLARGHATDRRLASLLGAIQRDLLAIGAQLADPTATVGTRKAKAAITAARIARLEKAIDARDAELPPLTQFILPGGSPLGASLHLARTICRRAERATVSLARQERVDARVLAYLNRLADLLFVLARFENRRSGASEDRW
jgi:cob(I)alamin adenosyltransferase